MRTGFATRLAALGLLTMFQFGALQRLDHLGCTASPTTSEASVATHAGHPMGREATTSATIHDSDEGAPLHDDAGCCCDGLCVCPASQAGLVATFVTWDASETGLTFREVPKPGNGPALKAPRYVLPPSTAPPRA